MTKHWWSSNTNIPGYPNTHSLNRNAMPIIVKTQRIAPTPVVAPPQSSNIECLFLGKWPKFKNQCYQLQISISKKISQDDQYLLIANTSIPIQLKVWGKSSVNTMELEAKQVPELWDPNLPNNLKNKPPKGYIVLDACSQKQAGISVIEAQWKGKQ
ncbi:unnamed protein product, partial [marine sediment metagenome]